MLRMKCPNSESLFELVSIPDEMSLARRSKLKFHMIKCGACQDKIKSIRGRWETYLTPEPDITSSLINVYSKLKTDETLILKGWKLGDFRPVARTQSPWLAGGWLFRGGIAVSVGALVVVLVMAQIKSGEQNLIASRSSTTPYAQFRMEDKNRIQVRYVQPELLESIEFQTVDSGTGR